MERPECFGYTFQDDCQVISIHNAPGVVPPVPVFKSESCLLK